MIPGQINIQTDKNSKNARNRFYWLSFNTVAIFFEFFLMYKNNFFIPPSRKGYFCSSISDRKSRFYPQVSKSRFYPLVNKVNLNLEHRMNKRVAAVMAADDRNSWSLAVVPTWRSKVVEETNSIFKIWCGNIKSRLRWESRVRSSGVRLRCLGLTWIPRFTKDF